MWELVLARLPNLLSACVAGLEQGILNASIKAEKLGQECKIYIDNDGWEVIDLIYLNPLWNTQKK